MRTNDKASGEHVWSTYDASGWCLFPLLPHPAHQPHVPGEELYVRNVQSSAQGPAAGRVELGFHPRSDTNHGATLPPFEASYPGRFIYIT